MKSRMSRRRALLCLTYATSASLIGCAAPVATPSGFLSDYTQLKPSASEHATLFLAPDFDPQQYGRAVLAPTIIYGSSRGIGELDPALRAELLMHVDSEIAERLKPEADAGPAALVGRAAETDVDAPNRAVNLLTSLVLGPVTTGGASLEVEVLDAASGQVQVAAMCAQRGSVIWNFRGSFQVLAHAKSAITECIQRSEQRYRQQSAAR